MKVFSRQLSGLGNQLFQYAAGCYFAERYGGRLHVIEEPVEGKLSHGQFHRPALLTRFAITAPVHLKSRFDQQMLTATPRLPLLRNALKHLGGVAVRQESIEQRYRFLADLDLPANTRSLYLSGYWQAYRYAEAVSPTLRPQLRLKDPPSGPNQAVLDDIRSAPASVSLHIRRGDYTLAVENNIALPLSFYRQAIALLQNRLHDPVFFIFSDDLAFARANLVTGSRQVFVEGNDDFSAHEDLRLMSACQHHIIANSSFSWWGAWLGQNPNKLVVAPKHWHLSPESAFPDLLPPEWLQLDSLREP